MKIVLTEAGMERIEEQRTLIGRALDGDAEAHKVLTFAQRYGSEKVEDKRVYSRDPEEIKAYYRDIGITKETFCVRDPEEVYPSDPERDRV